MSRVLLCAFRNWRVKRAYGLSSGYDPDTHKNAFLPPFSSSVTLWLVSQTFYLLDHLERVMGKVKKTFACTYENCDASFHRRYELKRHCDRNHRVQDPSKVLHKERYGHTPDPELSRICTSASRGVDGGAKVPPPIDNEHYSAPDASHTVAGISRQESFYDVANNDAALSAPEPSYNSWSQTSRPWEGSTVSSIASYTSNYDNSESTNTYATVQLSAAEHLLVNRFSSQPNILHGRVPRASYAQRSTDATSASTSQYIYGDRGVNLTGNDSVHTSAETPNNTNAFTWLCGPNPPGVQSNTWGSVASRTRNYDSSPYTTNSFPRVEPPFKNSHFKQVSQYGNGFVGGPAVQSNDTNSSSTAAYTASLYNSESSIHAVPQLLSAESHLDNGFSPDSGVPRAEATNTLASPRELTGAGQSIVPSINDTDRGVTGHHFPDIMIYMDVEKWDRYILDAQRKYTHL